jgi:hypothetical protein
LDKGKELDWVVVDADIADLDMLHNNIFNIVEELIAHFEEQIKEMPEYDAIANMKEAVEFLKEKASGMVDRVTPTMAKNKAIKLMEEVGIAEPRKAFQSISASILRWYETKNSYCYRSFS